MTRDIIWWHRWFLGLAEYTSTASKDPSTKTGAVIVRPDKTVASIGFNGFPKRMSDGPKLYANRKVKYSRIIHCEMNALIHTRSSVEGCTLYSWPFMPCDRCAVHLIEAGIMHFISPKLPPALIKRWKKSIDATKRYIEEAECKWTELKL